MNAGQSVGCCVTHLVPRVRLVSLPFDWGAHAKKARPDPSS
ncbi:hypothetical protein TRICHSKD4_2096 [Roseibium sp. TrichSKD4]|nr:hypothetical protein TRICHSKD4_2096 [Roseibium sp. TrichSKD4]